MNSSVKVRGALRRLHHGSGDHPSESPQSVRRGGPGSGHHGHAGRPGKVGGSAPRGSASTESPVDSFYNNVTAFYGGQTNGSLLAYDANGSYLGHIDWREFEGDVDIAWITVQEEMRRKGIATALVRQLVKEFEGQKIFPTMTTDDGTAFIESVKDEDLITFRHGVHIGQDARDQGRDTIDGLTDTSIFKKNKAQKAVNRFMTALERLFE